MNLFLCNFHGALGKRFAMISQHFPARLVFFCCFFIRFRCRKALASSQNNRRALSQSLFHGAKLQPRLIPMPLLIPLCLGAAFAFQKPSFQSSFMNIFNLLAIKRRRKWISIIASWRKLTYDWEKKKDKRFHLENQVDCCVLSSYLSLSTTFVSIAMRELFSCELTTVENSIWMFGKKFFYLLCSVFNWKPSWCCFNLSLLSIGAPRSGTPRASLGVVRANICSRVLSQLNAEEAEGRRTNCGESSGFVLSCG